MRDNEGLPPNPFWLLDLISLELHVLTNKAQNQRVKDLLELLFATKDSYHSLEFEWYDSVTVTPVDLQFYTKLSLQSSVRANENGCEVVNCTGLFELLSNAHKTLIHQGKIASTAHNTQPRRVTSRGSDWPTSYSRNALLKAERDWEVLSYLLLHLPVTSRKRTSRVVRARETIADLLMELCKGVLDGHTRKVHFAEVVRLAEDTRQQSMANHALTVRISYQTIIDTPKRQVLVEVFDGTQFSIIT
ncbi:hypothetical protein DFH11DRAFT_1883295 [Phellopilus nigrolimitatus]|nr:hypothetical protein DFH11DRAFT_1883295 [Phellopilus nigrolimitatus]